mmetsp:Transcript_2991/g.8336  ORF Transcript_2991/g.8336 Transcript_2991/m.8336 type:complete len:215 (-) Transcript_2991:1895-2539(-)
MFDAAHACARSSYGSLPSNQEPCCSCAPQFQVATSPSSLRTYYSSISECTSALDWCACAVLNAAYACSPAIASELVSDCAPCLPLAAFTSGARPRTAQRTAWWDLKESTSLGLLDGPTMVNSAHASARMCIIFCIHIHARAGMVACCVWRSGDHGLHRLSRDCWADSSEASALELRPYPCKASHLPLSRMGWRGAWPAPRRHQQPSSSGHSDRS